MRRKRSPWPWAFAAVIGLGILLRTLGYFDHTSSFWGDEANWASRLLERSIWEQEKRPLGYVYLIKALIFFDDAEWVWRLPSYLGEAAVFATLCLVGRALNWRPLAIFFVLVLAAFNPHAIVLAKEFKPYGLELGLHALVVYLAIRAFVGEKPSARHARVLLVLSPLLLPVAYNLIFVVPVVYGLAFAARWPAKRKKSERHRLLISLFATANIVVALAFAVAPALASNRKEYWGSKYDVFYLGDSWLKMLSWHLGHTLDIAAFSLMPKSFGLPCDPEFYAASVLICFGALIPLLAERRYRLAALVFGPWLLMLSACLFGHWPYGGFRTNLFFIAYPLLAAGITLDWILRLPRGAWVGVPLVTLWTLFAFPLQPGFYSRKDSRLTAYFPGVASDSRGREVVEALNAQMRQEHLTDPPIVIADWLAGEPFAYYVTHDRRLKEKLVPAVLDARLDYRDYLDLMSALNATSRRMKESADAPLWGIYSKTNTQDVIANLARQGVSPRQCQSFSPQVLCRLR